MRDCGDDSAHGGLIEQVTHSSDREVEPDPVEGCDYDCEEPDGKEHEGGDGVEVIVLDCFDVFDDGPTDWLRRCLQ